MKNTMENKGKTIMVPNFLRQFMTDEEFYKEAKASVEALKTINVASYPLQIYHNPVTNQVRITRAFFGLALMNPWLREILVANLWDIKPIGIYLTDESQRAA